MAERRKRRKTLSRATPLLPALRSSPFRTSPAPYQAFARGTAERRKRRKVIVSRNSAPSRAPPFPVPHVTRTISGICTRNGGAAEEAEGRCLAQFRSFPRSALPRSARHPPHSRHLHAEWRSGGGSGRSLSRATPLLPALRSSPFRTSPAPYQAFARGTAERRKRRKVVVSRNSAPSRAPLFPVLHHAEHLNAEQRNGGGSGRSLSRATPLLPRSALPRSAPSSLPLFLVQNPGHNQTASPTVDST